MGVLLVLGNNHNNSNEKTFTNIYQLFGNARKRLEKDIGVPICMPNCGKCCEVNQISVTGMEAKHAANWVRKQKPAFQDRIIKLCEDWLLEEVPEFQVKAGIGTNFLKPEGIDRLMSELQYIEVKTACPLMDKETKRCLIYPVRPLVCCAFGLTRVAGIEICKRPMGKKLEFGVNRAYANGYWRKKISAEIKKLRPMMKGKGLLPTLLYLELNPLGFFEHVYHNDIVSVKLSLSDKAAELLFQEELENHADREMEVSFLCSPVPRDPKGNEPWEHQFEKKEEPKKEELEAVRA